MKYLVPLLIFMLISTPVISEEAVPDDLEIEIHNLINEERLNKEKHGLTLVKLSFQSTLIDIARKHSEDMLKNGFFDHVNLEGLDASDRVTNGGVDYSSVGENLFWSTGNPITEIAEEAVEGWINSPGHYANILTDFRYTGIGIASDGDTYFITQVFISADPSKLREIGIIYDNDNLGKTEKNNVKTGISLTTQQWSGIVILLVIIIGFDANRRNRF